jgi:hypothetical protein
MRRQYRSTVVTIRIIELARRGELEYRRLVERVLKEAGIDRARPSLGMASEVPRLVPPICSHTCSKLS